MGANERAAGPAGSPDSKGPPRVRSAVSAPAKTILLGEHAVVYGEPCLSLALDLRTTVSAHAVGDAFAVNGYPLEPRFHGYFVTAIDRVWPGGESGHPVRFQSSSRVPSTSGIGSSAALTVATVGALHRLQDRWDLPQLAEDAFIAERTAQGAGSPNDTSVSTAGGAVLLAPERHKDAGLRHLWTVRWADDSGDETTWEVHGLDVPKLELVIGLTGIKGKTAQQVAKVRAFVSKNALARDTVREIGGLVWQALDALREDDRAKLGKLMGRCHGNLHTLGVNSPALQRLVDGAMTVPATLGAKLTGAGGGGAILALTTDASATAAAIERAGGRAVIVGPSNDGVRTESDLELMDSLPAGEHSGIPDEDEPPGPGGAETPQASSFADGPRSTSANVHSFSSRPLGPTEVH